MIKPNVNEAFNKQINWEMYSSYLYLSMSAYYETLGLKGFASWMRYQANEEWAHAMKFYDHIVQRGGRVTLLQIDAPPAEWKNPKAPFEDAYSHEKKVTGLIDDLVTLAISERDYAGNNFLQWFVDEQVEEEEAAKKILDKLELVSEEKGVGLLFMLDKELAERGMPKVE